jgi:hypothetical protein
MNLDGTVGGKGEVGRERGFSLTPTRVKSGQASHHSARREVSIKGESDMQKGKRKGGVTRGFVCMCLVYMYANKRLCLGYK